MPLTGLFNHCIAEMIALNNTRHVSSTIAHFTLINRPAWATDGICLIGSFVCTFVFLKRQCLLLNHRINQPSHESTIVSINHHTNQPLYQSTIVSINHRINHPSHQSSIEGKGAKKDSGDINSVVCSFRGVRLSHLGTYHRHRQQASDLGPQTMYPSFTHSFPRALSDC